MQQATAEPKLSLGQPNSQACGLSRPVEPNYVAFVQRAEDKGLPRSGAIKYLAENDPGFFISYVMGKEVAWHHRRILEHLQSPESRKKLVLSPRGFGKSTVGTVGWGLWKLLTNPNARILIVARSQSMAKSFLGEMRAHLESNQRLQAVWGSDLRSRKWSDEEFTISTRDVILREPSVTALGASGAVISRHYDLILADDLINFETARTPGQREKLVEWWGTALLPTLEPTGEICVIGTRYHPDDLYGTLIEADTYTVERQSALFRRDDGSTVVDGAGPEDVESLWPKYWPVDTLLARKAEMGSSLFQCQYQNDTDFMTGGLFDPAWYVHVERLPSDRKLQPWIGTDLAISQAQAADYFWQVEVYRDRENKDVYITWAQRDKLTFDGQVRAITKANELRKPTRVGIEEVAYQQAMSQHLKETTSVPVKAVKRKMDKISRAMSRLQPLFENGKVFFVGHQPIFEVLKAELLRLHTNSGHDDGFDALDTAVEISEHRAPRLWVV